MKENAGKVIKYVLSVAIAVALVYFAFKGMDWKTFVGGLKGTHWLYIVLSMAVFTLAVFFREERWRCQLLPLDPEVSRFCVWHSSNVGNLLNVVIPGTGEVYRCGYVSSKKCPADKVLGTILMERAWDVLAIVVLLLVAALANRDEIGSFIKDNIVNPLAGRFSVTVWWTAGGALLAAVLLLFLVFRLKGRSALMGKVSGWLKGILGGFTSFGEMKQKPLFLLYTVGIWACYILVSYLIFLAVPGLGHLGFAEAVFVSAVGNIASVIPTPGNIGPYHYLVGIAISSIYLGSGTMEAIALLYATLSHGSHAALIFLLGAYSYIRISLKKTK